MDMNRKNDPWAFHEFLGAKLSENASAMTLEDAFLLWEYENTSDAEHREALDALKEGLDDMKAGRTRPFEAFDREFRERHGLPPRA